MGKKDKEKRSCNICAKYIRGGAKTVCCTVCNNWVHTKCNSISSSMYDELSKEGSKESFFCIKCFNNEMPFGYENDFILNESLTLGLNSPNIENLDFKISRTEKKLINFLSKTISENNDPNIQNDLSKYYSIDKLVDKKINKNNYFSIFHLNIHSLQFHKNDLYILLDALKLDFDVITIS